MVVSKVKANKYEKLCSRLNTKEEIDEVYILTKEEKEKPMILLILNA